MFFCYILECSDGSFYVGVSEDPQRRLAEHNAGKGSDWTAERRPVKLVWAEEHPTLASARRREIQLKRWGHANKAKLIAGSTASDQDAVSRAKPEGRSRGARSIP